MFDFSSKEQRRAEEELYAKVAEEIEHNEISKPLWTKALADSENDKQRAQALYIKYRVQKLKDDISDKQESLQQQKRNDEQARAQVERNTKSIDTLNSTVGRTLYTFQWLILLMIIASQGLLFISYIMYEQNDFEWLVWILGGVLLLAMSLWLYFLTKKIKKSTNIYLIKRNINLLFGILIPFSLVLLPVGIFAPLIGLFGFIAFVSLVSKCIKFNRAFNHAMENRLI